MNSVRLRQQRIRLWKNNPLCHWCGEATLLIMPRAKAKAVHPKMATVDHLFSRFDDRRKTEGKHVLACYSCNQQRCVDELSRYRHRQQIKSGTSCYSPSLPPTEIRFRLSQLFNADDWNSIRTIRNTLRRLIRVSVKRDEHVALALIQQQKVAK